MWYSFAKMEIIKHYAQSTGGLGPPGGGQFTGFSLSTEFGGPRWYPLMGDDNLKNFIDNQFRYNPQYVPIGEAAEFQDTNEWQEIAELGNIFLGKDPKNIKVIAIPDGKEQTALLIKDEESNEFRVEKLTDENDDIVKQLKNWEFMITEDQNGYNVLGRKRNSVGSKKGIFEMNGAPSTPGFGYIWRDGPSATPSNNKHGDLTDNLWDNWRSVDSPGGVVGFR